LCYPAHEYTANNLRFCCSVDDNRDYYQEMANYLLMKLSTSGVSLPTMLETELKYNLFLRCHDPLVWKMVALKANSRIENEADCFVKLRELRNVF
jgi:hydroxyacylglutathione hydrolase